MTSKSTGLSFHVDGIVDDLDALDVHQGEETTPESPKKSRPTGLVLPKGNGHAARHPNEPEGFMCHECMVEAWQNTDYSYSPGLESIAKSSMFDETEEPDRCATPNSMDRLLQPMIRSLFNEYGSPPPSPGTDALPMPFFPQSSNVSSHGMEEICEDEEIGDQSSMNLATPPIPPPKLSHISLMDNPFEQPINIKTMEGYNQALRKFWTTTALLLGPDFDYNYESLIDRIGPASDPAHSSGPLGERAEASWPVCPTTNVGKPQRNIIDKELLSVLESMGMAWRWFTSESAVVKYIDVRVAQGESWDFGYCFERIDGTQHCQIMRATVGLQEHQRIYEEVVDEPKVSERMGGTGCTPRFWWCLQHPRSKEKDIKRRARDKRLNERYAEAKRNVQRFRDKAETSLKFAVEESRKNLYQDLEVREKVTGRYSINTMNTILQLADMAECLDLLDQAEKWNRELISRRVKRLGENCEHACYARYKLAQLLMKAGKWDEAKNVSMENIEAVSEFEQAHPLFYRQYIQACAIAMQRRRVDAALGVKPYLEILLRYHPTDIKNHELALNVIIEAHTFKRQYEQVVDYLPKLIALYVNGFGTKEMKLQCQYNLAFALTRAKRSSEAVKVLKECIALAKELEMTTSNEELLDVYAALGQILFEQKEWNPAKFYLENAARGYRAILGKEDPKYLRTKTLFFKLEKAMKIKLGLAERLFIHQRKEAMRKEAQLRLERGDVNKDGSSARGIVRRKVDRLRDLLPAS